MTPDQRPPYPQMPAYGQGYRPGGEASRPVTSPAQAPDVPTGPPVRPHGVGLALALSVAVNALTLVGVLALHWPAGNVFLLFWAENVVLGLITLVRVGTTEVTPSNRVSTALFFCVHYGLFCAVHLSFAAVVARRLGVELSFLYLGLPVALLVVRYTVELVTTWFGEDGLRRRTSPRQAMIAPYPRIVVLQVGVLLAFGLVLVTFFSGLPDSPLSEVDRVLSALPPWLGRPEVLAVVILMGVKTLVDVITTRRALRPR